MSEGKLAAQVAHAVKNLAINLGASIDSSTKWHTCDIVVLGYSDKKFDEQVWYLKQHPSYRSQWAVQKDKGLTEVTSGTVTAIAWIENE